ncbi:DUF6247 family protein [Nonomuraea sp. LPB2021202275-12-8]|uniref:DUF6247 family protein n=1 Tax=Nonomuraea sp. LPB2021202275-12-8 TaxID=3120159 RepID=UPI00300C1771
MSAQPVDHIEPDPDDILAQLPEADRQRFLAQYHRAVDQAHETWRYRQLRELLAEWSLYAVAAADPAYAERARAAKTGEGFVSAGEVAAAIPGWPTQQR